ncbi:MAG: hypothetical protein AB3N64_07830 [Puniceicoccaceae bacterium]
MHYPSSRNIHFWILILIFLPLANLTSGQDGDEQDWQTAWAELESRDDLSDSERVLAEVELLLEAGEAVGWVDPVVWDRLVQILDNLEASPALESARNAYIALLLAAGSGLSDSGSALAEEALFREYLQRALGISAAPSEEGQLLLYLAESLLRSDAQGNETKRRVEVLLQQSVGLLPDQPPKDMAHLRLAQLYTDLSGDSQAVRPVDQSFLARAVYHNRYVIDMEQAREAVQVVAREALDGLLQPGLELVLRNRFLPQSDIGITIATRNITEFTAEIYALPWNPGPEAMATAELKQMVPASLPSEETLWFSKSFNVSNRDRFAWERAVYRLGESLPGGWYGLRLTGGGLSLDELLLVTPLELTVLPRSSGSLSAWAVDAETGNPVPGAVFHVMNAEGEVVASGEGDANGLVEMNLEANPDWAEVHVSDGINPAWISRGDLAEERPHIPILIPGSVKVQPGNRLNWILAGANGRNVVEEMSEMVVQLPDGQRLPVQETQLEGDLLHGSIQIPDTFTGSGPAYLLLPEGPSLLLTHIGGQDLRPFRLTFTGDRIESGKEVFHTSTPIGVQVHRRYSRRDDSAEFLRLRLSRLQRQVLHLEDRPATDSSGETLYETIIRIGPTQGETIYADLPDLPTEGQPLPVLVEVLALETEEIHGRAIFALSPYRSMVSLRASEKIVAEGEQVTIDLGLMAGRGSSVLSLAGELAVYRETFESRYINRKRGTVISEGEYLALPDRSLLGSAKTDYRVLERGFVREAVDRIPLGPDLHQSIPVELGKGGYYQIEFEGREQDFRAFYPEGPLEIWVIPESGDLRAFRSEQPRLIHERHPEGTEEVLVLLDRPETAVLLDLEFSDGTVSTEVIQPDSNALYRALNAGNTPLVMCHAVVAGEMESTLHCRHLSARDSILWELEAERTSGLNPGSLVDWTIRPATGQTAGPVLWALFPDRSDEVLSGWLKVQEATQQAAFFQSGHSVLLLGESLPLYNPLDDGLQSQILEESSAIAANLEALSLYTLYPELVRFRDALPETSELHALSMVNYPADLGMEVQLPSTAGRWQLLLFHPDDDGTIDWQAWNFSTELPIRTAVEGPGLLRLGDEAIVPLSMENTTRRQETLQVVLEAEQAVAITGRNRDIQVLEPGQQDIFPVGIIATAEGTGRLLTRAEGSFSSSEAVFQTQVAGQPVHPEIRAFLVMPGEGNWEQTVTLPEWTSGSLLVSSGLGAALMEIWPLLRKREAVAEPLLASLGDWALEKVRLHHGILKMGSSREDSLLAEQLERYASSGGWTWTLGGSPDPWLSALVLWSLETFSGLPDDAFSGFREDAATYLESVLIDESVSREARLFALRSLAVPAFHDPRIRPSRIQAKSFLEFLHQRDQLSNSQLASLLQVARAFRFNEEVRLLLGTIKQRYATPAAIAAGGFWGNSLVYLSLAEGSNEDRLRQSILSREFEHLTRTGPSRSWEQFGGFMNLLAAFLWEGDFDVDGTVELLVEDEPPVSISLRPHGSNRGKYLQKLGPEVLGKEALRLQLDSSDSQFPVAVVLIGERPSAESIPAFPEQSIRRYREFVEPTLLSGARQRLTEFSPDMALYPGDGLQVHVSFYVEEPQTIAELEFMIPAGASLPVDSIQYSFDPSLELPTSEQPELANLDQPNPLKRVIRMRPLQRGRHDFILSFRIDWAGTYDMPQSRLLFPRTGRAFSLGEQMSLKVSLPDN